MKGEFLNSRWNVFVKSDTQDFGEKSPEVPDECSKAFEAVITKWIEAKWRVSSEADDLLEQYRSFLSVWCSFRL